MWSDALCDPDQKLISHRVAQRIVDALEVVEVHKKQRDPGHLTGYTTGYATIPLCVLSESREGVS